MIIGLTEACKAVEMSSFGKTVNESSWMFPLIEAIHLTAMVVLVGTISAFDLRLLGVSFRRYAVSLMSKRLLNATWTAFVVMAVTGAILFTTQSDSKYCHNWAFQFKLLLIAVAGINMAVFHFTVHRSLEKWDTTTATPLWAKVAGSMSVLLWAGVVVLGRWIGFA